MFYEGSGVSVCLHLPKKRLRRPADGGIDTHFPNGIPLGLILNSDNGSQFGARAYLSAVRVFGIALEAKRYGSIFAG